MSSSPRLFRFLRREVLPRWRSVFLHRNAIVALAAGVGVATAMQLSTAGPAGTAITFTDLCTATLAFAGLSFGGAMTCCVLAIGLPADRVLETMVVNAIDSETSYRPTETGLVDVSTGLPVDDADRFGSNFRSLYSDLVFVFMITAVAQLLLACVSLICMASVGGSVLSPPKAQTGPFAALVVMISFCVYAIAQLASSLRALSSVARNRDSFLRADLVRRNRNPNSEA